MILMKKIIWLLILFLIVPFSYGSDLNAVIGKQWFVQAGVFKSLKNALSHKNSLTDKLDNNGLFATDREFNNYITLHKKNDYFIVLIGPYANKKDASEIKDIIDENFIVIELEKHDYSDFEKGKQFFLKKISENCYNNTVHQIDLEKEKK